MKIEIPAKEKKYCSLSGQGKGNDSFLGIFDVNDSLDGIVQDVGKQGIQVRFIHEAKINSIAKEGETDIMFLTIFPFIRKHDIQGEASRPDHDFTILDGGFQLNQGFLVHVRTAWQEVRTADKG